MAIHLKACPSCSRHARISESTCPFCGAAFPASFRTPPPFGRPARRLTRAALVSLGAAATAVGLLEACSGDVQDGQGGGNDAGPDVVSFAAAYGVSFDSAAPTLDTGAPDRSVADTGARDQSTPDVIISFADAYGVSDVAPPEHADAETEAADAALDAMSDVALDAATDATDAAPNQGIEDDGGDAGAGGDSDKLDDADNGSDAGN